MIRTAGKSDTRTAVEVPTLWGLNPTQLHDRFWAARGVQVVRLGQRSEVVHDAELFLLTEPRTLVIFRLSGLMDQLNWLDPMLMCLRLQDTRDRGNREIIESDAQGRFLRFNRYYGSSDPGLCRVALTPSRRVAVAWQTATDSRAGWRLLRHRIQRNKRIAASVDGAVYDRNSDHEVMQCLRDLVRVWKRPDATIPRVHPVAPGVWADTTTRPQNKVRFVGPTWMGAGRSQLGVQDVVGPAILWDAPEHRPEIDHFEWLEIEPSQSIDTRSPGVARLSLGRRFVKRAFDIVFALVALILTRAFCTR